jgi:hypothetical protein
MPPNRLHLQINPYDSNSNKTMHLHGYAKQVILALAKNNESLFPKTPRTLRR